jgi:uncharacterized membrane protein YdfJ with MMPL/SSD domain
LAFVSMATAPDSTVKVFATGLAAGILIDATVIRALLVPAVVSLLGRWNWWLPTRPHGCCASSRPSRHAPPPTRRAPGRQVRSQEFPTCAGIPPALARAGIPPA